MLVSKEKQTDIVREYTLPWNMGDGVPFNRELCANTSAHSKFSTCGKPGLENQIQRIQEIMII